VLNHLDRAKLDVNRSLTHGAQGNPDAEEAWHAYHGFIEQASAAILAQCGHGHLFDVHSNGRSGIVVELGYGLSADELKLTDEELGRPWVVVRSNVRHMAGMPGSHLAELIRGESSLGGLLAARGYPAYPGPDQPSGRYAEYFSGGFSVFLHGSRAGGGVDATQIEVPYALLHEADRERFAISLAEAMVEFLEVWYGFDLRANGGPVCSGYADVPGDHPDVHAIRAVHSQEGFPACSANPTNFCPDEAIRRGELVQLIGPRASTVAPGVAQDLGPVFIDVSADDPLAGDLARLWVEGVLTPCRTAPMAFCPEQDLTRKEAAYAFLRLAYGRGWFPPPAQGQFADVPERAWSAAWLEAALRWGIIGACQAGDQPRMCPDLALTRGEAAEAAWRVMALRQILISHPLSRRR
jgi:hypothetical protein